MRYLQIILLLMPALLWFMGCHTGDSTEDINTVKYDKNAGEQILFGEMNREGLKKGTFRDWYQSEYKQYQPDTLTLKKLDAQKAQNATYRIVLGTWCPDSRREVPRFVKIADFIGIPKEQISMFGVNRKFEGPSFTKGKNGVVRVPTIIIRYKGEEIGRIVESPKKTLEKDLLNIL